MTTLIFKPAAKFRKVNSAKLTADNRVYVHPVCANMDGTYTVLDGWKLIGWGTPPWHGGTENRCDAIVYEKLTPAGSGSIYDNHYHSEPGLYWGHGNTKTMLFPV